MSKIEWVKGEPPKNSRNFLLKFNSGIICTGEYRYGRKGEPQQSIIDWRCDCCGRFATPKWYAVIE